MYHVFVHVFTAISKFSFGFWRVCGEGRHVFVFRVLFLNPVKHSLRCRFDPNTTEQLMTVTQCILKHFPLWFALLLPWPPPLPHTMHHLFFPFSASIALLSLSSHIRPPSLIHHPFNVYSLSIPVIWDRVCWSISGFFLWPCMVIRKAQITVITRFGLILGKVHAKHASYRECCELLLFNRLLGCSEWFLGHFQAYWLQKHTSIFEDHVRLRP